MAKRLQQARPMVGAAAGFDRDEGRWQLAEVADHLGPPELAADNEAWFSSTPWIWNTDLAVSMPMRVGMFTGLSSHLA
jgi:hypothetical protein